MAECNVQTLLSEACASGFRCLDEGQYRSVMLQLLCELNATIAAASSGEAGAGSPEGVVTANPGTTYLNTTDESFWVKKTGTGTNTGWVMIVGGS